jgi:hypothetical protein
MFVVTRFSVNIILEDRDHILIGILIQMMDLISPVENICKHISRRGVDNRTGDDVRHVSMVAIFRNAEFLVREKLANGTKMHIATKYSDSNRLCCCQMLQFLDEPISFVFVMFCCPVIIQIIQDLDSAIKFVNETTKHASPAKCFDRIHGARGQNILQEIEAWVCNRHTQKDDQVLSISFDNVSLTPLEDPLPGSLAENFIALETVSYLFDITHVF